MIDKRTGHLIHDLRNKLTIIQHYFSYISDGSDDQKAKHSVELNLNRCVDLINEFTNEHVDRNFQEIEVSKAIMESSVPHYKDLEDQFNIKINLSFDLPKSGRIVAVNLVEFKKVRENIVENAKKANATELNVSFQTQEEYMQVTYKDNGNGISDDLLTKINKYSCSEEFKNFQHVGTKIIKDVCHDNGFTIKFESSDDGANIILIAPYIN